MASNFDGAHSLVDKRIEGLDKQLSREYNTALKDLKKKLDEYLEAFKDRDAKMEAAWKAGKIAFDEYKTWRRNQILTGEGYRNLIKTLSKDLTNVNKVARSIINNSLTSSFIDAANFTAYTLEKMSGANFATLYNKKAVGSLLKENPNLLPLPKGFDPKRDIRWNMSKINSAITQGILQGEAIPDIAKRLQLVTNMTKESAVRNARTLHTQAESIGREQEYKQAEESGIELERQWVTAMDDRVRDAHAELDGQTRPEGEPFENSLGEIMYPGDITADPANFYNCRCATRGVIKGHKYRIKDYTMEDFKAWEKDKKEGENDG